jgi:hypothetical protein
LRWKGPAKEIAGEIPRAARGIIRAAFERCIAHAPSDFPAPRGEVRSIRRDWRREKIEGYLGARGTLESGCV